MDGSRYHPFRPALAAAVVAVVVSGAFACDVRDTSSVGQGDEPLVLLLSPAHRAGPDTLRSLQSYLRSESGLAVDVQVAASHEAAVFSAGNARADAFLLPLFDYLFCHQEYGAEAALQVVRRDGLRTYRGEILVPSDSEITTLADLDGRSVGFVDRYSTSGFLLPTKALRDAGVTVTPVFLGSHDAALEALRRGRVAAAAAYQGAAGRDAGLRVIARTDEIPNEPVFFRRGLDEDKRAKLTAALVGYAGTDEGRRVLPSITEITGFAAVDDRFYRQARELISAAGHSVEDLVPLGWQIHNDNRLTPADYAP